MTLHVELVSPEDIVFEGEADMVICRTIGGGDIAFQPGHVPFIGALDIHPVDVNLVGGEKLRLAVSRGFVEVSHDGKVSLLSDMALQPDQIDAAEARSDGAAAQQALAADSDDSAAEAALRWATVRLEVLGETLAG